MVKITDRRPDAELVARACQRDPGGTEAYGVLVRRHEGQVRSLLRALCRNPAQADDLAQDAFIRAWQRLAELREPTKFLAWVKRLAYRLFLHAERRRKVEARYLEGLDMRELSTSAEVDDELSELLALCRPLAAELMVLVYGFGFTIDEIAHERAQPVGTIKSQLSRAKQRIRTKLDADRMEKKHARI